MSNKFEKFLDEPTVKQVERPKRVRTETISTARVSLTADTTVSAKLNKTTIERINIIKLLMKEKSLAVVVDKAITAYIEQLPFDIQEQLK